MDDPTDVHGRLNGHDRSGQRIQRHAVADRQRRRIRRRLNQRCVTEAVVATAFDR